MITEKELRKRLRKSIKEAGNISKWAKDHALYHQRGNISEMARGNRNITSTVAKILHYKKEEFWILDITILDITD